MVQVSSVELERVVVQNVPEVLEAAAVGFPTPGGGPEQLHLFLVLTPEAAGGGTAAAGSDGGVAGGCVSASQLQQLHTACQNAIKQELNPLFKVQQVIQVDSLPRTASNKVMRRMLKSPAAPVASKM
jgi:acyl-coenzyme A synthetase/AMP-(fatty) acid ligase